MSRIYFKSPSGGVEIRGSERAYMSSVVSDLTTGLLESDLRYGSRNERFTELIPDGNYLKSLRDTHGWVDSYLTAWSVGMDLVYRDRHFDTFTVSLNTIVNVGNDLVCLLARIHAQCEIYGYILGDDRSDIAALIDEGLECNLYREDVGWARLADFLRSNAAEPVVMSYSVTEGFPNPDVGSWMPTWPEGVPKRYDALSEAQQSEREERQDAFYELAPDERWQISFDGLLLDPGLTPIKRANLRERYGHQLSLFDLRASDWQDRLTKAVGLATEHAS